MVVFWVYAGISLRKILRRNLGNKAGTPVSIFLSDEQSKFRVRNYAVFREDYAKESQNGVTKFTKKDC